MREAQARHDDREAFMGASQRQHVVNDLTRWVAAGQPAVLATVVASSSSAPRGVGAQLAVTVGGLWTGALSGGCAEVSVLTAAEQLLALTGDQSDRAALRVTMTRDELGEVGPVCGATLDVLIERVDADLLALLAASARPAREISTVRRWSPALRGLVRMMTTSLECDVDSGRARPSCDFTTSDGGSLQFSEEIPPTPRLVVCGAGDVSAELIRAAQALGWRTTLIDPRTAFVAQTVLSAAPDQVFTAWPDDAANDGDLALDTRCACVAAAHETRIDVPFLTRALPSPAFYVGSIGSRVVQFERKAALAQLLDEEILARHHGPAGLSLGGGDASEIALSIIAEIVAVLNGRTGVPLRATDEPIRA
ncbi:MAG: XdhC family protein, partial [Thermoleophilia bacterium]|nr:XdhC family protein [Thermoleophilia bacterium]